MQNLRDAFAAAATRALRVGLDLVEWHAAHAYLLRQFERFGVKLDYSPEYRRAHPEQWPGAPLARPRQTTNAA